MKKILYAWDFHGTLEQGTEKVLAAIFNALSKEYGLDARIDDAFILHHPSFTWRSLFEELSNGNLTEEQLQNISVRAYSNEFFHFNHAFMAPQPHAKEVLERIRSNGDVSILVSNSRPELIRRYADVISLSEFFAAILGIEKLDPRVAQQYNVTEKKAAEIRDYQSNAGINFSKTIMIGNTKKDVAAGQQVGAVTYLYRPSDDDRVNCEPDYCIEDLREILR